MTAAGLATATPPRGDNARAGNFETPGTTTPNIVQQNWVADVATRVLLPMFKARGRPFVLVYWSRDPDASQHNQGDSFGRLQPGINGATSLAGIRNADDNLRRLREALVVARPARHHEHHRGRRPRLLDRLARERDQPRGSKRRYADVVPGHLPPGFLSLDLAEALGLPLWDPGRKNQRVGAGEHTNGHGLLGRDPAAPDAVVAADGGVSLIYLKASQARGLAPRVVAALMAHDYVSGIFVDDPWASIAGTLPMSAIRLVGGPPRRGRRWSSTCARSPPGCEVETNCGAMVSNLRSRVRGTTADSAEPRRSISWRRRDRASSRGSWTRCRSATPTSTRRSRGSWGCLANRGRHADGAGARGSAR